jgi:hypothetical protein
VQGGEGGPLPCDGDRCDGVARASSAGSASWARVERERNRAKRERTRATISRRHGGGSGWLAGWLGVAGDGEKVQRAESRE